MAFFIKLRDFSMDSEGDDDEDYHPPASRQLSPDLVGDEDDLRHSPASPLSPNVDFDMADAEV